MIKLAIRVKFKLGTQQEQVIYDTPILEIYGGLPRAGDKIFVEATDYHGDTDATVSHIEWDYNKVAGVVIPTLIWVTINES